MVWHNEGVSGWYGLLGLLIVIGFLALILAPIIAGALRLMTTDQEELPHS